MNVQRDWKNYINGRWVNNPEKIEIIDPGTGKVIAAIAKAGQAEVDEAVAAAKAAHEKGAWRGLRPIERGRKVMGMGQYLLDHLDEIAQVLTYESGKPLDQAITEVRGAARYFEFYGSHADKFEGRSIPLGSDYYDFTVYEPFGVTAHVIPWNYPIEMVARSSAAALATGNTCVIKTPELDPLSSCYVADAAEAVGLESGLINILAGYGAEAGVALVEHPDVNQIVFTGSVPTGQSIMRAAANTVVPTVMELGGKSAGIVFPDANLTNLAEQTKWGIFMNSGQVCSAMSRLIVHQSKMNEVAETLADMASGLTTGHGIDNHFNSPLISENQLNRVKGFVDVGKNEGELITGGSVAERDGYFMKPTIFQNVPADSSIAQQEIFGPVISLIPYEDEEEAIAIANNTEYGLVAGVFTQNIDRAMRCARDLQAGQVFINEWYAGGVETPFGGFKKSGFGREKGVEAMFNYVQTKNIAIKIGGR